jgi:hypothetical protein
LYAGSYGRLFTLGRARLKWDGVETILAGTLYRVAFFHDIRDEIYRLERCLATKENVYRWLLRIMLPFVDMRLRLWRTDSLTRNGHVLE